ncbi:HAMP domain-containing methyl-accepting chemotaxis protein [Rhizobium sp. RU36D]|uniref:methyl-accepting chemotaxis protein n=1 Tax=Rhizobium sp. RU36D TaxID=1907415 RepID=UPI0009D7D880|nr:HAMP domain-containing methyl-accepting chemotaxis protein [Rhizobium sp. RU36D]SMC91842.1 Methyl-accepting chemotaxis protein [Rhizobium sp. RU36D]
MKRPTIKTALISMVGLLTAAILALSVMSLSGMSRLQANTTEIGEYWMQRMVTAREIKGNFNLIRLGYAKELLATTPEEVAAEVKFIADRKADMNKAIADYDAGVRTEKGRQLIDAVKAEAGKYLQMAEGMVKLQAEGNLAEAVALFKGDMAAQTGVVNAKVDELVAYVIERAGGYVTSSEDTYANMILLMIGLGALSAIIAIGSILFAIKGVANPVNRITDAMKNLSSGDTATEIPYSGRQDEIGDMASAVEVFRQNAIANKQLEDAAAVARGETEATRIANQRRVEEEAQKLRFATESLGDALQRLASGDISFQLNEAFAADYEPLRQNFNASLQQLAQTIGSVLNTVTSIDSGTREISDGANDLSKRTEQQAAALEETAAALDEITVNVRNSSQRTEEARSVAVLANQNAAKSAQVVSQAVDAMKRIEDSSQQISNIIGVIDEIAFQTNLLALNAGVEAARAGEAGKGFAVVAQEVRELAQRSAQAAKEIKALITASSTQVSSGVSLVGETGTALKAIGDYVVQINGLMDAIAVSAREQSTGLAEVNTAVNQMDQTTQQNAAMVEQSTAASAALASEAARLRELVGQFRLPGGHAQPALAASRPASRPQASQPARRPMPAVAGNTALKEEWSEF